MSKIAKVPILGHYKVIFSGLKIPRGQLRIGSSPIFGTIKNMLNVRILGTYTVFLKTGCISSFFMPGKNLAKKWCQKWCQKSGYKSL